MTLGGSEGTERKVQMGAESQCSLEELDKGQRNATRPLGTVLQEVFMEQLLCQTIWTMTQTDVVPALVEHRLTSGKALRK